MNYEEMSDKKINKSVGEIVHLYCFYLERKGDGIFISRSTNKNDFNEIVNSNFDPCNNPSDAWPIILKHGISINFDGIDWEADTSWMGGDRSNRSYNNIENNAGKPLRAAMICFLKMKESENG